MQRNEWNQQVKALAEEADIEITQNQLDQYYKEDLSPEGALVRMIQFSGNSEEQIVSTEITAENFNQIMSGLEEELKRFNNHLTITVGGSLPLILRDTISRSGSEDIDVAKSSVTPSEIERVIKAVQEQFQKDNWLDFSFRGLFSKRAAKVSTDTALYESEHLVVLPLDPYQILTLKLLIREDKRRARDYGDIRDLLKYVQEKDHLESRGAFLRQLKPYCKNEYKGLLDKNLRDMYNKYITK
ncbi:hypothetical protein WDW89_26540 [Deltaproteobacteria bacterium TL4]